MKSAFIRRLLAAFSLLALLMAAVPAAGSSGVPIPSPRRSARPMRAVTDFDGTMRNDSVSVTPIERRRRRG